MELTSTKKQLWAISKNINTKNQNIPYTSAYNPKNQDKNYNSKTFENNTSYNTKLNTEKSINQHEKIKFDIKSNVINNGIKSEIDNRRNKNPNIEVLSDRMQYKNSINIPNNNKDKAIELNNSYTQDKNNFRNNVFFHSIIETNKKENKSFFNKKKLMLKSLNQGNKTKIKIIFPIILF